MTPIQIAKGRVVVPFDGRIVGLFPGAKEFTFQGKQLIALKHNYSTTLYLRSVGYEVPAPVLTQYHFPHPTGETPYQVQLNTVAMMTTAKRGYVLNGLGTGKTRCSLWAFDYLQRQGLAHKLLVIAKLSTVTIVWAKELFNTFPHLKVQVLTGTKDRRLKRLAEEADVYIINHDGATTLYDELQTRRDIDVVVVDELSTYRNGQAKRTKLMKKLLDGREWAWGLTGSPTPKSPTDVYGQCQVVTPWTTPRSFNLTRQMLCYKAGPFRWEPKDNAVEKAIAMMTPAVRYSLSDIIELPDLIYRYIEIPLGVKQRKAYTAMKNAAVSLIDNQRIDALNAGAALSKLLQIALGWVYTRDGQTVTLDNEARLEMIVENINEAEHKVIVFVPFKSALKGIGERLDKEEIEHAIVSGSTPKHERDEIFTLFQHSEKYKALVAHPACMAHGLTLTAADTIIWAGAITDLETFMQANGRITRLGQKHKQLVLMLGGTPAEKRIYTALGNKENIQNKFLDLIANASL